MRILIIGYGVVGKNMKKIFPTAEIIDPAYPMKSTDIKGQYDIAFVCVPTDMKASGECDTSLVEAVIKLHSDHVDTFCIRSTVPPGTCENLKMIHYRIVFSPEYFGATIHANNPDYEFIILGGDSFATSFVARAYIKIKHPNFKIYQTDCKVAELCKYMENSFLALKVAFCNEFYRIAKKAGIEYTELRELFLADPRVNRSHTFVYEDHPFYDSHCLNKDIPALIYFAEEMGYNANLMKQVVESNNDFKQDI